MAYENDLGRDDIKKLVLRLAIPSMLAQFVNVLYSIVDRMYIGNIPVIGDTALAGVGVCGPIVTLISSFAFLVGIGGAPLLAIRLGEDNREGAYSILYNCFIMLLALGAVLTALALIFCRPMLLTFGASEHTLPYAQEYLYIYAAGTLFAIVSAGLNQFIVCQGYARAAMTTVLMGAVLNIMLDPLFIFVLELGVKGAALATVISQAVSCLFVLAVLFGRNVRVRIERRRVEPKIIKRVLALGLSPFIIGATDSLLLIVLNMMLMRFGGSEGDMLITAATIVQSYMQLVTLPLGGISGGTQPILSFNYGAKNIARIKEGFRRILLLSVGFTSVMLIISQFLPRYFVLIFTSNPQLISLSVWGIRVFTMGIVFLSLQYTFVDGFTALGIAGVAVSLSLTRKTTFLVLTLLLPALLGAKAAFFSEPLADIFCSLITTVVFLLLIGKILRRRAQSI